MNIFQKIANLLQEAGAKEDTEGFKVYSELISVPQHSMAKISSKQADSLINGINWLWKHTKEPETQPLMLELIRQIGINMGKMGGTKQETRFLSNFYEWSYHTLGPQHIETLMIARNLAFKANDAMDWDALEHWSLKMLDNFNMETNPEQVEQNYSLISYALRNLIAQNMKRHSYEKAWELAQQDLLLHERYDAKNSKSLMISVQNLTDIATKLNWFDEATKYQNYFATIK